MPATQADYDRLGAWAVMYDPDPNIDRRKSPGRTVPLEVLHFAFPRTGSLSMVEAYQILGYPSPYHYSSIFANVRDCDMWIPMLQAKQRGETVPKATFDRLLGHCSAVSDVPCLIFWRELLAAYPDAKVVLVERDERKWHESFQVVLSGVLDPFCMYVLRFADPATFGRVISVGLLWIRSLCGTTHLKTAIENAVPSMRKHYADVRAAVPSEKLLVYQLGSGWEPLCKFLDKPIPNVPFPHRNEAKSLQATFGEFATKGLKNALRNGAIIIGVPVVGILSWRYLRT